MHQLGLHHGKDFTKSANTVGTVLARYHPHGDTSVYDALVGLATCRYPLVEGKGNFGSVDGDPAAAYRYTEARLHRLSGRMIGQDDSIIETQPNFDDRYKEPVVFAAELPFLLLNGCSGIAVGIASEVPPHNLTEVVGACCAILEADESPGLDVLLEHIRGPDYGSGVLLSTPEQVRALYGAGEGQLSFRCQYHYDGNQLIITSYAPRFNMSKFVETCEKFREAGNIQSVTNKSSKKDGTRIVVCFSNPRFVHDHVLPLLETSVSYRFFVNESKPDGAVTSQLGLSEILGRWVSFRIKNEKQIIKAQIVSIDHQIMRVEAKKIAAINLKKIAQILTDSEDPNQAIMSAFKITTEMANIILDTPLRSLARLQVPALDRELVDLKKRKQTEERKLQQVRKVVAEKLREAVKGAGDDTRKTLLGQKRPKLELPSMDEVQTWVACSRDGKVLRLDESPEQRRGSMKGWDQLIQTGPFFWVVLASGQMLRTDTASLVVGKPKSFGEIAGIVSSAARRIAVMDETGEGIVLDAGTLIKDKYQALKTQEKAVRALGMRDTDCLFAWNKKAVYAHKPDKLPTTRVNSSGWKLLPKYKYGATEILAAPTVDSVLTVQKQKLQFGAMNEPNPEVAASGRCYVEWDDNQKAVASARTIANTTGSRKISKILSIG
jgi:DNA gyrase/topoisomerase IV subunit A